MKKCTRCGSLWVWNRTYCPLCGADANEAPVQAKPVAHVKPKQDAAASVPDEAAREPEVQEHVEATHAKETPAEETRARDLPPRPVSSIPGLEYLDEDDEPAAPPQPAAQAEPTRAAPAAPLEPLEPLEPLTLSPESMSGSAMFERTGSGSGGIPVPPEGGAEGGPAEGEFLKMFPGAKPE